MRLQVRISAWGIFAPRSTQPSIPPGSVNEYQLRLGRQRQVWLILLADETQGVQVKLISLDNACYTGARPSLRVAIQYVYKRPMGVLLLIVAVYYSLVSFSVQKRVSVTTKSTSGFGPSRLNLAHIVTSESYVP